MRSRRHFISISTAPSRSENHLQRAPRTKKKVLNIDSVRQAGAGRQYIEASYPKIHEVFLEMVSKHTAGCPMNEEVKWTYLNPEEIVNQLAAQGILVSTFTVRT